MCTPAHTAYIFLLKCSSSLLASSAPVSHGAFLSCWQKKEQWKTVFWTDFSVAIHKLHVFPRSWQWLHSWLSLISLISSRWVPILSFRGLLIPDSSGLCSAQKFQQRFGQYTRWFGSEREYSVSILFFPSMQMCIKRCTLLEQCHVSIKPTEIGVAWLETASDSLRFTSHVAVCQIRSSTERAIPNQSIFQVDK